MQTSVLDLQKGFEPKMTSLLVSSISIKHKHNLNQTEVTRQTHTFTKQNAK